MKVLKKYGKYTWRGWLGAVLVSFENGVKEGDVRKVGGRLVYVFSVEKRKVLPNIVKWSLVEGGYPEIEKYEKELFWELK